MKNKLSLALAAALFALPLTAFAQDEEPAAEEAAVEEEAESPLTWNLAVTSDYVFRGVSQTDEDPAIQGGIDYGWDSGWYVGLWASNVDFGDTDGPDIELDAYIGYNTDLSDEWNLDLSVVRYNYFGERDYYGNIDYNEFIGALTYAEMITFTLAYTPDVYALSETGMYYNIAGSWELGNEVTLDAGIGLSTFDNDTGIEDYMDWSIGVSRNFGPVNAALGYYGTDGDGRDNFGDIADDRLVLTLSIEG